MCIQVAEFVLFEKTPEEDMFIGRICSLHLAKRIKELSPSDIFVSNLNVSAGFPCDFEEELPTSAGLVRICTFLRTEYGIHLNESTKIAMEAADTGIPQQIPGTNIIVEFVSASRELWSLKRIKP